MTVGRSQDANTLSVPLETNGVNTTGWVPSETWSEHSACREHANELKGETEKLILLMHI